MFKDIDEILLRSKYMNQRGYWVNKLSPDIEKTKFPILYDTRPESKEESEKTDIHISGELFHRLLKLGKQSELSLYIILLTVLEVLIFRYSNNHDIVTVSPVYKPNITEDTLNDHVFIRTGIEDEMTFIQLLLKTRQAVLEAYENQDYPCDKLIEHLYNLPPEPGNNPLSGVVCLLADIHGRSFNKKFLDDAGSEIIFSFRGEENRLQGQIFYNLGEYGNSYMRQLSGHFTGILEKASRDGNIKISRISFLSEEEEKQLLNELNRSADEFSGERTLVELFEVQADRTPGKLAVVFQDNGLTCRGLTYRELNEKANGLAWRLRSKQVKAESIVAIIMERSIEMIIGILAVLKAGGAFLPIDNEYPVLRKRFVIADSEARVLLTRAHFFTGDQEESGGLSIAEVINVDAEENFHTDAANLEVMHTPDTLAYIIYTSGTSGNPRGVAIPHRAIMNYIDWTIRAFVKAEPAAFPLYTSISFDLTLTSIFTPLLTGSTIVVYGEEEKAVLLERIIEDNRVEAVKLTPSHLKVIKYINRDMGGSRIKRFIVGGEEFPTDLALEIYKKFNGKVEIYNEYGPTEAAVGCTSYRFESGGEYGKSLPIGRPISNMQIYILDKNLGLVPYGVAGELCISGEGLARGYLNRVQLTGEKFRQHPFIKGRRLYCSGDLARCLLDENIEFLGRIDSQVKIRGFRIELGEIESRLRKYSGIKEVVVTVITNNEVNNEEEDKKLCAYITMHEDRDLCNPESNHIKQKFLPGPGAVFSKRAPGRRRHSNKSSKTIENEIDTTELIKSIQKDLPSYMIPQYYIKLDSIPLTPNGKVDIKALPRQQLERSINYVAARNPMEEKIVEIWSGVLGVKPDIIGIDSNFFELGGNSLKATIMMAKLHKEFSIKVPLEEIFKTPTVRGLAGFMVGTETEGFSPIEPSEKKEYYELSSAQRRLYLLQQMQLGSTAYNMPLVNMLTPAVEGKKLETMVKQLIRQNETLRTSFHMLGEKCIQQIHSGMEFAIDYYTVEDIKSSLQQIAGEFIKPFDLSCAPLLRIGLIGCQGGTQLLLVDMHHIISDGFSLRILLENFAVLYGGGRLSELRIQYKDYSQWQNRENKKQHMKKQEKYWLNRFRHPVPALRIPSDFPADAPVDYKSGKYSFEIGSRMTEKLRAFSLENGCTLFVLLLAIYNVLLSKYTLNEDMVVGTPVAGRQHADLQDIIGMFVNMLAIRNFPVSHKTFREFLLEVRMHSLEAFENQDYPFDELVMKMGLLRKSTRNPLVEAVFNMDNFDPQSENETGTNTGNMLHISPVSPYANDISEEIEAKFDLVLAAVEYKNKICFNLEYSRHLFKPATIERMSLHFRNIINEAIEHPDISLSDIQMLGSEEKMAMMNLCGEEGETEVGGMQEPDKNKEHSGRIETGTDFDFLSG